MLLFYFSCRLSQSYSHLKMEKQRQDKHFIQVTNITLESEKFFSALVKEGIVRCFNYTVLQTTCSLYWAADNLQFILAASFAVRRYGLPVNALRLLGLPQ